MSRIRFDFGTLTLDAELADTPTARAVLAKLPYDARVMTWTVAREPDARAVVTPGEVAYWPDGPCIALGYGRTPISQGGECRLASPCNIFGKLSGDARALAGVKAGSSVKVSAGA